jgi:sialate O-acetylesterase
MKNTLLFLSLIIVNTFSFAQLRLPALLSNGMVLQQKDSVTLWGWAGPGESVNVITGWDGQSYKVKANDNAAWKLKVSTPIAGGPYTINLKSRNEIILKDVMIGEVWLCSGQSNMEWSHNNGVKDIEAEFADAAKQNIRFFHVPKTGANSPQDDVKAEWTPCDSNTLKSFSAVGYFFGKRLQQQLNVPIGLINASWGGTPADTWTPASYIESNTALKQAAAQLKPTDWWPTLPGQAYNGMIAPLGNYSIAGSIWYQGESNTQTNSTYHQLFTTMIDAWRNLWKKQIPFYYVQIDPYNYGANENGAFLQEAQTLSMTHPKTGMVVVTDLIDSTTNIHPSHKKPVGNRLANWALADNYGKTGIAYKSPKFSGMSSLGDKLSLEFINIGSGLRSTVPQAKGFFIADVTANWYPAEVKIENNRILVSSRMVKKPTQVRYGFGNTLVCSIETTEGLPLIPFRTDGQ